MEFPPVSASKAVIALSFATTKVNFYYYLSKTNRHHSTPHYPHGLPYCAGPTLIRTKELNIVNIVVQIETLDRTLVRVSIGGTQDSIALQRLSQQKAG